LRCPQQNCQSGGHGENAYDAIRKEECFHNRMSAIREPVSYGTWLGERKVPKDEFLALLRPYPAEKTEAFPASTRVGNVKNDGPALLDMPQ